MSETNENERPMLQCQNCKYIVLKYEYDQMQDKTKTSCCDASDLQPVNQPE